MSPSHGEDTGSNPVGTTILAWCKIRNPEEMVKADLIASLAEDMEMSKKDAQVVVDTLFETIANALIDGDKVELRGFGSFRVKEKKAREGRNPKTGEKVSVPPKRIPYFKPGKDLKIVGTP